MKLTKEQQKTKEAIVQALLEIKKSSYNTMLGEQQGELAMAEKVNDNDEGLYEKGKVDQSINRIRATSQVTDSLEAEIYLLQGIIDHIEPTEDVQLGDVLHTNQGNFFVAVPADAFDVNGTTYRGISTDSPLYLALRGKQIGDTVTVNGNEFTINDMY